MCFIAFSTCFLLKNYTPSNHIFKSQDLLNPGGLDGKVSAGRQCERPVFDPWVGKILWRRKWQPAPVLLPGKFHGWRSLVGYSPWGRKESDMTERLNFHFHLNYAHCIYLLINWSINWKIPVSMIWPFKFYVHRLNILKL